VLREHEAGAKTADLARKHGVSEATLYNPRNGLRARSQNHSRGMKLRAT
jgi:putative transposase